MIDPYISEKRKFLEAGLKVIMDPSLKRLNFVGFGKKKKQGGNLAPLEVIEINELINCERV